MLLLTACRPKAFVDCPKSSASDANEATVLLPLNVKLYKLYTFTHLQFLSNILRQLCIIFRLCFKLHHHHHHDYYHHLRKLIVTKLLYQLPMH